MLGQIEVTVVRHLFGCEESRKGLHQEAPQPDLFLSEFDKILSRYGDHLILGKPRESQLLDSLLRRLQIAEHCYQIVVGIEAPSCVSDSLKKLVSKLIT